MSGKYALLACKYEPIEIYWLTDIMRLFQRVLVEDGADVVLHVDNMFPCEPNAADRINMLFLFQHQYDPELLTNWPATPTVLVSVWNTVNASQLTQFQSNPKVCALFQQAKLILTFLPEERDALVAAGFNAVLIDMGYHAAFEFPFYTTANQYDCTVYGAGSPWQHDTVQLLEQAGLFCKPVFELCHAHRDGAYYNSKAILFLSETKEASCLSPQLPLAALYHKRGVFSLNCISRLDFVQAFQDDNVLIRALKSWCNRSDRHLADSVEPHFNQFKKRPMRDVLKTVLPLGGAS